MKHKPLPIGIEDFEKMITKGFYYVDKTFLIKDLIDNMSEVSLFTRPRRFGKSLNMSMLQYFFDIEKDSIQLFDGLNIMSTGEQYTSHMNQYPVINLTFKASGKLNFKSSVNKLIESLISEFDRHSYILDSHNMSQDKKNDYAKILNKSASIDDYSGSLKFLSNCLEHHHKKKVIILIDEYDVPLENAYFKGFYEEMIDFIRSLLGDALKTNSSLNFAVLTGCLRISKESIFTGLNNLRVISILTNRYSEYFGFTEKETEQALTYYHLESKIDEVREWYNGYYFGDSNVYNPWSVIHYLDDTYREYDNYPISYWANTSSNDIIRTLIKKAGTEEKEEIENLIKGGIITKPVHEDITYEDIDSSMDNLWNVLLFVGYLKKVDEINEGRKRFVTMNIPNEEVLCIYEEKIIEWFHENIKINDTSVLCQAIVEKDTAKIAEELNNRLVSIISFYDSAENFYHGFLVGILSNIKEYRVKSNRETGFGRSDIFMKRIGSDYGSAIFEIKTAKQRGELAEKCTEALEQIKEKKYVHELEEDGYRDVILYGISFCGKECMIKTGSTL
ncbi:MAG: ATP-binding protein [Lachnoclostridium sp.]|jgi:hypothetical protein|nr:ATP-binding protein [Lachnoclostridium sp.]